MMAKNTASDTEENVFMVNPFVDPFYYPNSTGFTYVQAPGFLRHRFDQPSDLRSNVLLLRKSNPFEDYRQSPDDPHHQKLFMQVTEGNVLKVEPFVGSFHLPNSTGLTYRQSSGHLRDRFDQSSDLSTASGETEYFPPGIKRFVNPFQFQSHTYRQSSDNLSQLFDRSLCLGTPTPRYSFEPDNYQANEKQKYIYCISMDAADHPMLKSEDGYLAKVGMTQVDTTPGTNNRMEQVQAQIRRNMREEYGVDVDPSQVFVLPLGEGDSEKEVRERLGFKLHKNCAKELGLSNPNEWVHIDGKTMKQAKSAGRRSGATTKQVKGQRK